MKKLRMVFVLTLMAVLAGCGGKNSPKGAVESYFKAMAEHDIQTIVDLLDWEHQTAYQVRYTELAVIRSLLEDERARKDHKGEWDWCREFLDKLDKMIVDKQTETNAVVVCYDEKGSKVEVEVNNVNGVWKVAMTKGDPWILSRLEPGYEEINPFCNDVVARIMASRGNESAQKAIKVVNEINRYGGASPKETVETLLVAMKDFDLITIYNVMDVNSGLKQKYHSAQEFEKSIMTEPSRVSVAKRLSQLVSEITIGDVEVDGDSATVKISRRLSSDQQTLEIKLVKHDDKWFVLKDCLLCL